MHWPPWREVEGVVTPHRSDSQGAIVHTRNCHILVKLGALRQAITAAAALNDVGSWALISFQATFYTRVYDLTPDVYAPALATILPIGGIVGGVGGGLLADWLSKIGGRSWLTAGASVLVFCVIGVM